MVAVPPLDLPRENGADSFARLQQNEAVMLFVERAAAGHFRAEQREPGGRRPPLPSARLCHWQSSGGGADQDPDLRADPRLPG
jgi:hypothetical protein